MKIVLILLLFANSFLIANESIVIKMKLTNSNGSLAGYNNEKLSFGLDKNATDGIDVDLGEAEIPPCSWAFACSSFLNYNTEIGEDIFQYIDLKAFPNSKDDSVVYTFRFYDMVDSVNIEWENIPAEIYFARMRSSYLSVHWNDINMKEVNKVVIDNPAVNEFKIVIKYQTNSSVEEIIRNEKLISPNPASESINININDFSRIEIFNIMSAKVFETSTFIDKIDVSSMPKGIYLINITTKENKTLTQTFILSE